MRVAIIGAGMAGLFAARELKRLRPDLEVRIYERSGELGGRVATGCVDGLCFDYGAQYLKTPDSSLSALVEQELAPSQPQDIPLPVWVFDGSGRVSEGDPLQNNEAKWTWAAGLRRLAEELSDSGKIRLGVDVARFEALPDAYTLYDQAGERIDQVDAVLLTPAAPHSAALVAASSLPASEQERILGQLGRVSYRPCISLAYAYERQPELAWYAAINFDRQHDISWLACEHTKPGRVRDGSGLLVAQLGPNASRAHWDELAEGTLRDWQAAPAYLHLIHQQIEQIVGCELGAPRWVDLRFWDAALPDGKADFELLNSALHGLFFAGDFTAGQGRVHLALEQGQKVAQYIAKQLV